MDGEANFNWRFVYELDMMEAEQMMVVEHKEHPWSLHTTQERRPPQLTLQLWDNDLILRDDYLSKQSFYGKDNSGMIVNMIICDCKCHSYFCSYY